MPLQDAIHGLAIGRMGCARHATQRLAVPEAILPSEKTIPSATGQSNIVRVTSRRLAQSTVVVSVCPFLIAYLATPLSQMSHPP
jgi:hypothetical protein